MHKQTAKTLRAALKAVAGVDISHMQALEVTARLAGKRDWHQLERDTRTPRVPADDGRAAWDEELRDLTRALNTAGVPAEDFDQAFRDNLSPDQVAAELTLDAGGLTVELVDLGEPLGGEEDPGSPDAWRLDVAVGADPDVRDARVSLLTALPVTVHADVRAAFLRAARLVVLRAVAEESSVRRACERLAQWTPEDVIVHAVTAQGLALLSAVPTPAPVTWTTELRRVAQVADELRVPEDALAEEVQALHEQLARAHVSLRLQLTCLLGDGTPFTQVPDGVPADDRLRPLVRLLHQRQADAVNAQGRDAQLAYILTSWGSVDDTVALLRHLAGTEQR